MSTDMRRSHRDRKQTDFFHFKDNKINSDEVNDDNEEDDIELPKRKEKKVARVEEDDDSIDDHNIQKTNRIKQPKKVTKKSVNKKIAVVTNNLIFGKTQYI
jgi:hypothetical protein